MSAITAVPFLLFTITDVSILSKLHNSAYIVQVSCIRCVQLTLYMDEPEVYSGLSLKPLTSDRSIFRRTSHTERAFDVLNTLRR